MKVMEFKIRCKDASFVNEFYVREHRIKCKNRIKAKIFERENGTYQLCIGGLGWIKNSLQECKDHVCEYYSDCMVMLTGESVRVKIK